MSIEQLLADNLAATKEQTEAVRENTARLMEMIERSAQAQELVRNIEEGKAKTTTRGRGKKDETPAADEQKPAETSASTGQTATKTRDVDTSPEGIVAAFGKWLGGITDEKARAKAGTELVAPMLQNFGAPNIRGIAEPEQRYQATFYLARFEAGLPVDYSTDYDFDGDPLFDKDAAPAGDDLLG